MFTKCTTCIGEVRVSTFKKIPSRLEQTPHIVVMALSLTYWQHARLKVTSCWPQSLIKLPKMQMCMFHRLTKVKNVYLLHRQNTCKMLSLLLVLHHLSKKYSNAEDWNISVQYFPKPHHQSVLSESVQIRLLKKVCENVHYSNEAEDLVHGREKDHMNSSTRGCVYI